MIEEPLISVIICTYNGAHYIEKAIKSVINQTYSNFEIIIVDDGSTDETVSLVFNFTQTYKNIFLYRKENEGLASSRSFAFSVAKGDWFAIIDQDDLCYSNRLIKQFNITKKFPTAKLIFSDTNLIDENDKIFDTFLRRFDLPVNFIPKVKVSNLLLRKGCFVDSESWFMHRSVYEKYKNLDFNLKFACDFDYFIKIGFEFDFAYSREILSAWRVHKNQQSSINLNRFNETKSVLLKYLNNSNINLKTKVIIILKYFKLSLANLYYKFR